MKQAWETVVAYKLVWLRVTFYALLPALMLFDSYTETWSASDWANQSDFAKFRLYVKMGIAGAAGLVAFLDQSMARARDTLKERRDTEFISKHTGP